MTKQKNQSVYRPMLWRAFTTAWAHKELWPFAVLAGFASTGVVVNDVIHQAQFSLLPAANGVGDLGGDVLNFLQNYIGLLLKSGASHMVLASLGMVAILTGAGFMIVLCQQLLLVAMHRAVRRKKQLSGRELLRALHHHHFLRILGVDLLFHVGIFLVLGGGGALIRELPLSVPAGGATALLLAAATLFTAFVLNVIGMLTLIAVGQEHVTITQGIREGIERFLRHPLVACEVALLLFATNLVLTVLYALGLVLIGIPFGILFAELLVLGSYNGMITLTLVGAIVAVLYTMFIAGLMTTFTYASWTLFVEQLNRAPFPARMHHYTRRVLTKH